MKYTLVSLLILAFSISAFSQNGKSKNSNSDGFSNDGDTFIQKKNLVVDQSLYVLKNFELSGYLKATGVSYFGNNLSVGSFNEPTETLDVFGNTKVRGYVYTQDIDIQNSASIGQNLTIGNNLTVNKFGYFSKIGIGLTTEPSESLEVLGNAKISDALISNSIQSGSGQITGNWSIGGELQVTGNSHLASDLVIDGSVGIGGTPSEKLDVRGNIKATQGVFSNSVKTVDFTTDQAIINNTLRTDGLSTFNGDMTINGATTINNSLKVLGESYISQKLGIGVEAPSVSLDIAGSIKATDNITTQSMNSTDVTFQSLKTNTANVQNTLDVTGVATMNNTLNVVGNTNLTSDLNVGGNSILNGNLGIGVASATEKLEVQGNAKISETLSANTINATTGDFDNMSLKDANISNTLTVDGVTTLNDALSVGGNTTLNSDLNVSGNNIVNGNLGVGVSIPTEKVDVQGNIRASAGVIANSGEFAQMSLDDANISNTLTVGGATILNNTLAVSGNTSLTANLNIGGDNLVTGSVGIGVAQPSEKLDVAGNIKASQAVNAQSMKATSGSFDEMSLTDADVSNTLKVGGAATLNSTLAVSGNASMNSNLNVGGNNVVSGSVGIGVAQPSEKLDVAGNIKASQAVNAKSMKATSGSFDEMSLTDADVSNTLKVGGAATLNSTLAVSGNASMNSNLNVGGNNVVTGSVGIGVNQPSEKLDVAGNIKASEAVNAKSMKATSGSFDEMSLTDADVSNTLKVGGAATLSNTLAVSGNASMNSNLSVGGNNVVTGSIGIGVNQPSEKLDVAGNIKASEAVNAKSMKATSGSFDEMSLTDADVSNTLKVGGAATLNNTLAVSGNASMNSNLNVGGNNVVTGSVGIGVTQPSEKLEVAGNIKASQAVNAQSMKATSGSFDEMSLTDADIAKTLKVGGATTLSNTLAVTGNTSLTANLNIGGDNLITGSVGIGVTQPSEKLDISGNIKASGKVTANSLVADKINLDNATIKSLDVSADASVTKDLDVGGNTSITGSLGIGTTASEKLTVSGNIKATGSLNGESATVSGALSASTLNLSSTANIDGTLTASTVSLTDLTVSGTTKLSGVADSDTQDKFLVADANGQLYYRNLSSFMSINSSVDDSNVSIQEGKTFSVGTTATPSEYVMAVGGDMITTELTIKKIDNWPDYVFDKTYDLKPIEQVSDYINENKHLPEVPSVQEVEENGVKQGEMNAILLKKIEELTLYIIELKKENEEIKQMIKGQEGK